MIIVIATHNPGKQKEMLSLLKKESTHTFQTLKDFDTYIEPPETGTSFEENAQQKALFYGKKLQRPTIAEDAGIILDAFPNKLGVHTRRDIPHTDDIQWLEKFLDLLISQKNRRATFYSCYAYYNPHTQTLQTYQGELSGIIAEFPQTPIEKGIPASSVFIPDGHDCVLSSLSLSERKRISHRGKAGKKMAQFLSQLPE